MDGRLLRLTRAALVCLATLSLASAPASADHFSAAHPPSPALGPVESVEETILACVNAERARRRLGLLRGDPVLARAARHHAQSMLDLGFLDHTDPWGRGLGERVRRFGGRFGALGENIAAGYRSGAAACRAWISSSGHRANVLRPQYSAIGTGFARGRKGYGRYYVQVFGAPSRAR